MFSSLLDLAENTLDDRPASIIVNNRPEGNGREDVLSEAKCLGSMRVEGGWS